MQYYIPSLSSVKIEVTFCPKHRILKLRADFTAVRVRTTLLICYSGSWRCQSWPTERQFTIICLEALRKIHKINKNIHCLDRNQIRLYGEVNSIKNTTTNMAKWWCLLARWWWDLNITTRFRHIIYNSFSRKLSEPEDGRHRPKHVVFSMLINTII